MHETIKKLREQNNYSQSALAQILNISRQMYVKYENGEVDPPVKIITQLSSLYKVSYSFIIDDELSDSKKQNNKADFTYTHKKDYSLEAASPTPAYGTSISYKNKSSKSFETVVEALRQVPAEQLTSILAFLDFLKLRNQSEIPVEFSNVMEETNDKTAFFNLAGKIKLDSDELTDFRENSKI